MEIFISWSGERSKACAEALRTWLPHVLQSVNPWMSSEDIAKGERGTVEIAKKLDESNFGLVCLTPANLHTDWVNFEAGALSKRLGAAALFTFLIDLEPSDVEPPLGQFQHTKAVEEDVFRLVDAINLKTERPLDSGRLRHAFDAFWPQLEKELKALPAAGNAPKVTRESRDILEEILNTVRELRQPGKSETNLEVAKRKATTLLRFAEGFLIGKAQEAQVIARVDENEIVLGVTMYGESNLVRVSTSLSIDQAKQELIEALDNLIIPF